MACRGVGYYVHVCFVSSITVCNLNAIRQSYLPSSFQEEFTQIESYETERVEQRAEEERQQQVLQQQQQQIQNPGKNQIDVMSYQMKLQ